ncbi:cytochrome c [Limnoglobus roseus]|uniref:cytochrome c n=1 Tax=Limnoglobus roseus TaxID=2598579 RepID=UPI0011EB5F20|nr:cytochrome c [Limnoglobus roseus]
MVVLLVAAATSSPPAGGTYATADHAPTVLVPAYGPAFSGSDDLLKQILGELKGLRGDVQAMRGGAVAPAGNAVGVIGARCASCHKAETAEDRGGGFVLVEKDGTPAELSLSEKRRLVRLVGKGEMPPSGKLAEAEVKQLSDYFTPSPQEKK